MPKHIWGRKDALADLETKYASFEIKAGEETSDYLTVEGYGSVFGNVDGGGDVVMPGAFKASIATGRKVKMLWQHDPSQPIGVWDEMREDAKGLFMRGRVMKAAGLGAYVAGLVKMGAIDGLSIGYRVNSGGSEYEEGVRKLSDLDVWETSIVTFPMNEQAGITAMKSADDMSDAEIKRHVERALKEIKVSGTMAKAMAAGAMKGRNSVLCDADALPPETDQREVDELKALLTETLQKMEAHQ